VRIIFPITFAALAEFLKSPIQDELVEAIITVAKGKHYLSVAVRSHDLEKRVIRNMWVSTCDGYALFY